MNHVDLTLDTDDIRDLIYKGIIVKDHYDLKITIKIQVANSKNPYDGVKHTAMYLNEYNNKFIPECVEVNMGEHQITITKEGDATKIVIDGGKND